MKKLTDDIIAILVAHQTQQWTLTSLVGGGQCGDYLVALGLRAILNALFDHVTSELVL